MEFQTKTAKTAESRVSYSSSEDEDKQSVGVTYKSTKSGVSVALHTTIRTVKLARCFNI